MFQKSSPKIDDIRQCRRYSKNYFSERHIISTHF